MQKLNRHYNVRADLNWIKNLEEHGARCYLVNNLQEFLAEYIGQQPLGETVYGPNFVIPGTEKTLLESMVKTVKLAEAENNPLLPRLKAEEAAINQINTLINQPDVGQLAWIVPPGNPRLGFGNYGFLNTIKKNGKQITVKWYRYQQGKYDILFGSSQLHSKLGGNPLAPYSSENDIIRQPIIIGQTSLSSLRQIEQILLKAGLRLEKGELGFSQILDRLNPELQTYARLVITAKSQNSFVEQQLFLIKAKEQLAKVYYRAKIMAAAQKDQRKELNWLNLKADPHFTIWQRGVQSLVGSCPAVGVESLTMVAKNPFSQPKPAAEHEGICPRCGAPLDSRGHCPQCGYQR